MSKKPQQVEVNGEQMELVNLLESFTVDVNGQQMELVNLRENFSLDPMDPMDEYLSNQTPLVINDIQTNEKTKLNNYPTEYFEEAIIIPPLNTDIRFSSVLPLHAPTENEKIGMSVHNKNIIVEDFFEFTSPEYLPDNKPYLPWEHQHRYKKHPKGIHEHKEFQENFSWAISTKEDDVLDRIKKTIIHPVSTQHSCGSCWAVCFADTMSDCLVVSGAVGWSPRISATYIMAVIPTNGIQSQCAGGNPAKVAEYLESVPLVDSSCIDYSWCSGDSKVCTSLSSASHFDAKELSGRLNNNIPKPAGCYFGDIKKWLYRIDSGSDYFSINKSTPIDAFRNSVKSHILDYGPVIAGYVVLKNFFKSTHTNPKLNGGVYFDRADYENYSPGKKLSFSDSKTKETKGLHAVSIVGFGVARNIQYDNDKFGDVPYWHVRNSWGTNWGYKGYFKMAMYPFNKVSQFDKEVMTDIGGPVGSMILIRATKRPTKGILKQIQQRYLQSINRSKPDEYYKANADNVRLINREKLPSNIFYSSIKNENINIFIIALFFGVVTIFIILSYTRLQY